MSQDPSYANIRRQLKYAIILQHNGRFREALDKYRQAENQGRDLADGVTERRRAECRALAINASVQQAVLLERLRDFKGASAKLAQIGHVQNILDAELARFSLRTWYDVTAFKLAWHSEDVRTMKQIANRRVKIAGTDIDDCWTQFMAITASAAAQRQSSHNATNHCDRFVRDAKAVCDELRYIDNPGTGWMLLFSGDVTRAFGSQRRDAAKAFYNESLGSALSLTKYFLVAEAHLKLFLIAVDERNHTAHVEHLNQAIGYYIRCGVLPDTVSLKHHIAGLEYPGWSPEQFDREILKHPAKKGDPTKLRFGEMCRLKARSTGKKSEEIFEEFVRDWAVTRFPGGYQPVELGQRSIDGITVWQKPRHSGAIVTQARLYKDPKIVIHNVTTELLSVTAQKSVDRILVYYIVIATTREGGWQNAGWDENLTEDLVRRIRLHAGDGKVVTELDLQIEVQYTQSLYEKYFPHVQLEP